MKKCLIFFCLTIIITMTFYQVSTISTITDPKAPVYYDDIIINDLNLVENLTDEITTSNLSTVKKMQVVIQTESYHTHEDNRPSLEGVTNEDIARILKDHRIEVSEYYQKANLSTVETLNLASLSPNITFSKYTPFIFLSIDNGLSSIQISFISSLSTSSDIEAIYIRNLDTETNQKGYELDDAIAAANGTQIVNNGLYDGSGIIIGVLDGGIIDVDCDNFDDVTVIVKPGATNSEAEHATAVASILGGANGIAPEVTLLSAQHDSTEENYVDDIEWMIDNDANVINMSIWDTIVGNCGDYSDQAAYLDYIIRNTWVTIVGSAGNRGLSDDLVTSPKTGFNVITVGSVDNTGVLSNFSSFEENFEISKPNLVAPGENFDIPNLGDVGSGTSYSSPMVTGAIALLMDKKTLLILYPEAINAIISSSTTPLEYNDFDSSGLEETVGTGLLNIDKALAATGTVQTTYNSSDHVDSYIFSKSVYLYAGQRIRIAAMQLVNSDQTTNSMVTNYDLFLINNGVIVDSAQSTYNNIEFIDYVVPVTGYYYIKIKQISAKTTDRTDFLAMQYRVITASC